MFYTGSFFERSTNGKGSRPSIQCIPQKKYEVNHAANIVLCMECFGTLNYTGEYNYHTVKESKKGKNHEHH